MHATRSTSLHSIQKKWLSSFLCGLTLCLVLSGCQVPGIGNSSQTTVSTPVSKGTVTPALNANLKSQGTMELQSLQQWIALIKHYGGQADTYQQQYTNDQQALKDAQTAATYQIALATTSNHVDAIKLPAIKIQQQNMQQQLQKQVTDWENQHPHVDAFNGVTYKMGFEYDDKVGVGTWLNDDLATAKTFADYQQIVENTNMYLINFKAMADNSQDKTPYDQPHQADTQLMQTYHRLDRRVLVVSLEEQAMRVYDHGRLIKTFQVTTGQPDKPTPPGSWWVESHETHVTFKSSDPKGSHFWYPDTPINFAMQYHSNGYYIHDSWWRAEYGPNTQFPHQDATGDSAADLGSHGCVNMSKNDAQWVYDHVQLFTGVIIY